VTKTRFRHIFDPELFGRLQWFGRLRWLAVSGLAVGALIGSRLGLQSVWPSLFVVASVVAVYNLFFHWLLRGYRRQPGDRSRIDLRVVAICETMMDLTALMVTVHYTGGLQSPLLPFFAFHMAIGTIMIASRWTYVLAGGVSLTALFVLALQSRGVLGYHPLVAGREFDSSLAGLNLVTLGVALFGIVYLTDSVVNRLKQRSIELYEATQALGERTEELQRLVGDMADIERRKSHYMRISAHQLRSPVGTIRTVLRVLSQGYVDPATREGMKMLNGAVDVTDSLLAVINDLLDLAKLREGRDRAPWSRSVNLNQLLADLIDTLAPDSEDKQLTMIFDVDGVAILDWGVPPDLVHAFENLMYNAIKYSRFGGEVTVELRADDDNAVIRVIDRGIGIPEDYLDQVFMEFVRAPNAKHHTTEGTGLGLAIVKEVVEVHGGTIAVESRGGEGSVFTVRFCLRHTPPEAVRLLQAGNERGYGADTPPEEPPAD
jgi:signal transduction histidine kinase